MKNKEEKFCSEKKIRIFSTSKLSFDLVKLVFKLLTE